MGTPTRGVEDAVRATGVRFLFDENIPPVFAEALRLIGYNTVANKEVNLRGARDEAVIEYCGDKAMVWVTRDLDARKKAAYTSLVRSRRVSAVFIVTPRAKRWTMKEQFEVIVRHLRTLENRYGAASTPRYYHCRATGQPRETTSFAARPGR
jgi:predicted nuclease of predicted toxin-antitoxin system